ncbi:MAG: cytochrome c biogenesis protein CcsA [Candidatus Omnitrophica bacterium]|nr:cytochrome c biogenesis protein CcsA [Candidatus Omnitrophota bacterium]
MKNRAAYLWMVGALGIFLSHTAWSAEALLSSRALDTIRHLAIQSGGRVKPIDSFARETLQHLTGAPRRGKADPVETLLLIVAKPDEWTEVPILFVPFIPLREALGLDRKAAHVSYGELLATKKLMRMLPGIVAKQRDSEKLTILENETMDLYDRFVVISALFKQQLHLVPPSSPLENRWLPVLEPAGLSQERQAAVKNAWQALTASLREGNSGQTEAAALKLAAALPSSNPAAYPAAWRLKTEVLYNRVEPFRVARWLYGAACLLFLFHLAKGGAGAWGWGSKALILGFVLHGAGILTRVVLGGRPPVSNFYETMLWLPWVAVAAALVFDRHYRSVLFGLAAGILSAITLLLADHLPLDPSISPVVAVLRSNLWLTIHVLTIVASYGALGLGAVLAHLYGGLFLARRGHPALENLGLFLYRAIQVGVVLLAAGIMLGAVWANASWGRYWGWDPKETWALITLLWFLAILHGRFAGWLHGTGVALGTITGFFLLLMTYYGVSFYLVGLHSYAGGHAKPLPPLLIAYLAAEFLFIVLVAAAALRRRPARA